MNVDVEKIKDNFLNKVNDLFNQEVYFLKSCQKFPSKYDLQRAAIDDSLRIFFEENNKIVIGKKIVKYCDKDSKRKIRLLNIHDEVGSPEITIVNNYIVDDNWDKIDW